MLADIPAAVDSKIADFGVARFEATEGAITRVGTNIYSAPEHNPLVQTAQLDSGSLNPSKDHVTPAADIYSLAKTTYSLLAGESPRRFARHAITEMPQTISSQYWSAPLLRVLEKATQARPDYRYQTVEEFWDELSDAALPPTQPLSIVDTVFRKKPSSELAVEPDELTQAPPQPRFEPAPATTPIYADAGPIRRPRIVVPVSRTETVAEVAALASQRRPAKEIVVAFPDRSPNGKPLARRQASVSTSRSKRFLVASVLILGFSGMLLATHKYVTSHWNPLVDIPKLGDVFVVGREGVTTTDVNLRSDASASNPAIGLAEYGSRVKVLSINSSWYEVQVVEHGRVKSDPFSSDRGWINRKFVKFN